jgi:protein TonB
MGYQALLFCPDEKLAAVVRQVFSELDFAVEAVHDPFAAVKSLMAHRYDAIVVDSENEQNASLLFKSARNSSFNQGSLAIALVEGQTGVAKAYRIGANLVLTKPINVEQAKGTLRVARGLLRKTSDAALAAGSKASPVLPRETTSASTRSSFQPANPAKAAMVAESRRPEAGAFKTPLPATMQAALPAERQETASSAPVVEAAPSVSPEEIQSVVRQSVVENDAASIAAAPPTPWNPSSTFSSFSSSGTAAAPAPAKEAAAPAEEETDLVELEPAQPFHAAAPSPTVGSESYSDAPSFAALGGEDSGKSGGNKKYLVAAAAVLAVAAVGYLAYDHLGYHQLGKPGALTASLPARAPRDLGKPAAAPQSTSSPAAATSNTTPGPANFAAQSSVSHTTIALLPGKPSSAPSTGTGNSPVIHIDSNFEPEVRKADSAPILVKPTAPREKAQAQDEEAAPALPSPPAVVAANDSNLSGLLASAASNPPKPVLATLRISQGVSQGLLIKRVTPRYPPAALAAHAGGAVQIEATVNKEGIVVNPKVVKGDLVLAGAALEAVRQWRYKPYYLDGAPVEIQTEITITFKAN